MASQCIWLAITWETGWMVGGVESAPGTPGWDSNGVAGHFCCLAARNSVAWSASTDTDVVPPFEIVRWAYTCCGHVSGALTILQNQPVKKVIWALCDTGHRSLSSRTMAVWTRNGLRSRRLNFIRFSSSLSRLNFVSSFFYPVHHVVATFWLPFHWNVIR